MGPITLFDKSFLQSLKLDESVWFDHFFITNICPLFFIETLADLEKRGQKGRTAEREVQIIADKFPQMQGGVCQHHTGIYLASLLGYEVPMTGQVPLDQSKLVMYDGKVTGLTEEMPIATAFSRWQEGTYFEVERQFAKNWREQLAKLDLKATANFGKALGIDPKSCKTLVEAKDLADSVISSTENPEKSLLHMLSFLELTPEQTQVISDRWQATDKPSIKEFSPYAAHVLTVMNFFGIALSAGLISTDRSSNLVDIAYLFYLPFCMTFVSKDRLHRRTTPLFLRDDQEFIWGTDLKAALAEVNQHFAAYPQDEKEQGLHALANRPPKNTGQLIRRLWDKHLVPKRREGERERSTEPKDRSAQDYFDNLGSISSAEEIEVNPETHRVENTEAFLIKRRVRRQRGSWYQIPKNLGEE